MSTAASHTIDFCICTYNRLDYLKRCVNALLIQLPADQIVLTVIDNKSDDGTKAYLEKLSIDIPFIRYVYEGTQGLSHARNNGWKSSTQDWIFYLDDDCLPPPGFVDQAMMLISIHHHLDAVGGPIEAIFEDKAPGWLPIGFGSFSMDCDDVCEIQKGFIRGGCFLIKREILDRLNGFDIELGVTGKALRYGEEIELQVRMRAADMRIGYAPSLRVGHFVRTSKLSMSWVLRSEYARRRDKMIFEPLPVATAILHLLRTIIGRVVWFPVFVWRFLSIRSYSFKKALYVWLQPLAYSLGEWVGTVLNKCRE